MRVLVLIAMAFVLIGETKAITTVTGSVHRVSATALTNSTITFTPQSTPVLDGGTLYASKAESISVTNGAFSVSLVVGKYFVSVDDSTKDRLTIYVPNDSNTYDIGSLTTNAVNFASTNAFPFVMRTNGFAYNLTINSTSTPSPSAGQVLTRLANGTAGWSNAAGGSGEVSTAQLLNASNVLDARIVANDTTTSNGLYSLISGGGITAGLATNIAEAFATNSALVTSNSLYSLISTNPVVLHPGTLLVTNTLQVGSDVIGERVSSGVLGLRNNNTPQGIFLYRYSTNDNADTEYGFMNWFSTEFQVGVNKSGVGQNRSLGFAVSGSTRWRLGTDSSFAPTAVYKLGSSTLPIGDITSIGVVNASNVVVAGGSTTRVGVGTTNPAVELDLYGAMRYENLTASRLLGLNAQKDATNITLDASLTLSGDTLSVTAATNPVVFGPGIVVATNGYAIGGTSSSHTYLRRNGTQLLVRLGDDSAYAPAMASYWSSHNGGGEKSSLGAGGTGNLWTGSDGRLIWSSAASLSSGTGTADVGFYRYGVGTNGVGTSSTTPAGSLIFSNLHLLGRMTIPGNGASSNYVWTCTNSATGEGEWRANTAGSGSQTPWTATINGAGYPLTNSGNLTSTGTVTAVEFVGMDSASSGSLTLQATNPTGAITFTLPATSTASNNFSFHFSSITAGDVFKVHAVSGNNVVMTNAVDNNSGGGGGTFTNFQFTIDLDGFGGPIATGFVRHVRIPSDCTIKGWDIISDNWISGSLVLDVWKTNWSGLPATSATSIAGSEKPTLSSTTKNQDASLSTWDTACTKGEYLGFHVDSASTLTKATVFIYYTVP